MQSMDDALDALLKANEIDASDAYMKAFEKQRFAAFLDDGAA